MKSSTIVMILCVVLLAGCSANKATVESSATIQKTAPSQNTKTAEPAVIPKEQQNFWTDSKTFLQENLKKPGVKELLGGTQYRVIEAGTGPSPTGSDTVDVHFVASRPNGNIISTTGESQGAPPQAIPIRRANNSLRQALLEMKVGDHWEVVIPPSNLNKTTDNEGALIYDIKLISIH